MSDLYGMRSRDGYDYIQMSDEEVQTTLDEIFTLFAVMTIAKTDDDSDYSKIQYDTDGERLVVRTGVCTYTFFDFNPELKTITVEMDGFGSNERTAYFLDDSTGLASYDEFLYRVLDTCFTMMQKFNAFDTFHDE